MPSSGVPPTTASTQAIELELADISARLDDHAAQLAAAAGAYPSAAAAIQANSDAISALQGYDAATWNIDGPATPEVGLLWALLPGGRRVAVPRAFVVDDTLWASFLANVAPYDNTLTITSGAARATATQGQSGYSDTLTAVGGSPVGAKAWSRVAGSLPSGLTLNVDGTVTGNVSGGATVGAYSYTAQALDPYGATIQKTFTMNVVAVGPTMTYGLPDPVPVDAVVGQAFAYATDRFIANAAGARTYALTSPPAGWTIDASGGTAGTIRNANPTTAGVVTLSGTVTDGTTPLTFTTHVIVDNSIVGPTITTASLPIGTQNAWYAAFLADDGNGTNPKTWSRTGGAAIPTGLSLTPTNTTIGGFGITSGQSAFTLVAHGLAQGEPVLVGANGAGLAGTAIQPAIYFVLTVPTANTVTLATDMNSSAFVATGSDNNVTLVKIGGSIWGKPSGTVAAGQNITWRVTDATTPTALFNEASIPIEVKATGGGLALGTMTVPHLIQGAAMTPFRPDQYVTGATGTPTFYDWNHGSDITASSDVTANTLHGTGLGAKANGTFVQLTNLGTTTGVSATLGTHYVIVNANSGADTIQVALAAGGTPIDLTGANASGILVHFPTLPNKKVRFDYDGSVTGHQGALYTAAGDPPTTAASFGCTISVNDVGGTGTWLTQVVTITIDASGPTLDLNGYTGITFGASPTEAQVIANATAFNNAHAAAQAAGARLMASANGTGTQGTLVAPWILRVGKDKTGAGGGIILTSGSTNFGGAAGHDDWDIGNVELTQHDGQPMFSESSGGNTLLWIGNVSAGFKHFNLRLNYNAALQADLDVKRAGGTANRWGLYGHTLQLLNCGPIPAGAVVTLLNSSGRTGNSGTTLMSSTSATAAGSATKSLPVANRSLLPNGSFDITIEWDTTSGGVTTHHSVPATVTAGAGTGAGTLTLSANATWANGASVNYSQYAEETFVCQMRRCKGGDGALGTGPSGVLGFDIHQFEDDAHSSSRRASGWKSHFVQDSDTAPAPLSTIRFLEGRHGRHCAGAYCGGRWQVLAWSIDDYEHALNVEDGDITGHTGPSPVRQTQQFWLGQPGVSGQQGTTSNCTRGSTSCGFQHNGNGLTDSTCDVKLYGHTSTNDDSAVRLDGRPPAHCDLTNQQVNSPNSSCGTVTGSTAAKAASVAALTTTNCFVHLLGSAKKLVGGTLGAGQDWTGN